ncbi:hypothetical protein Tco_0585808 [Tanacetum coccineum]
MHEDLRIHARYNPPRADQAFIRENSEDHHLNTMNNRKNGIIKNGRPSTTHRMLKFPVKGGTVTIRSSRVIPMECAMISGPRPQHPVNSQMLEEMIKVAIHPEYTHGANNRPNDLPNRKDAKNYVL